MSSQLIRPGESLSTSLVLADVRLFSGVLPDVHLKVGELQVTFCATWVEAHEWLPLFLRLGYGCLLTNEIARLLHWWPDMGDDKSRMG